MLCVGHRDAVLRTHTLPTSHTHTFKLTPKNQQQQCLRSAGDFLKVSEGDDRQVNYFHNIFQHEGVIFFLLPFDFLLVKHLLSSFSNLRICCSSLFVFVFLCMYVCILCKLHKNKISFGVGLMVRQHMQFTDIAFASILERVICVFHYFL